MEATLSEFAFVDGLPKREKTRLAKLWEVVKEVTALQEEHGPIINQAMVAAVLGVSKQRVAQLIDQGMFQCVPMAGTRMVTLRSLEAYCTQADRTTGSRGLPEKFNYQNAKAIMLGKR